MSGMHAGLRRRSRTARIMRDVSGNPVRTLTRGQGRIIDRTGCGIGVIALALGALSVAGWVIYQLHSIG
jgi:hypothetical protein